VASQGNVTIQGNNTTANKLTLNDKGTTFAISFKAADTLTASTTWTLPTADGSSGQVLATNGSGVLSWASGLAPTGAASGDLTGNFPNPSLAAVGTAGTYTKVITDSKGRVIGSQNLLASDIPTLPASIIGGASALPVSVGGTGATSLTANGVLVGNGVNNVFSTAAGSAFQSLVVPSGGGAPAFGPVNLGQSAAITGTLPIASGGTGSTTVPQNGQLLIGNGTGYAVSNLSAGTGISIANTAGSITISASADAATKVSKTGDTMTGALVLPTNGLTAGSQFVLASNNVGIGTTAPTSLLDINGALSQGSMTAPTVSGANQGRIYFDSTSKHFYVSEGGGNYSQLLLANSNSSNIVASSPLNLSGNALTLNTVPVGQGGTGLTTLAANSIPVGNGTNAMNSVGPGTQ
jgi:trimeric autotransporter adhesin